MIEGLQPSGRRALAVGLLVAAVLAAAGIVYLPFWLVAHEERELARANAQINEIADRLPLRERLLAEERALQRTTDLDKVLLRAPTPGVAAAQLQGDLANLATDTAMAVTSVQILEPAPAPPFTRIGLRLSMTGDVAALRDFLYAVETRVPVLVIDSLGLIAPETLSDASVAPQLTATVELHGWMRATAAAAQAGTLASPVY